MVEVAFEDLQNADLQIDCVYKGGPALGISSDPLSHLFLCGNAGGFRRVNRRVNRRDIRFLGLAAPGNSNISPDRYLVSF